MNANERQVGGDHYKQAGKTGEEHWDRVARLGLDYFQGQITKYVERWRLKNGVQDLEKARHFLDKYIELESASVERQLDTMVEDLKADAIKAAIKSGVYKPPIDVDTYAKLDAALSSTYTPGQVKPTGWTGFTFEGADAGGFLFTCRQCRAALRVPPDANPYWHHACPVDMAGHPAPKGYVDQDQGTGAAKSDPAAP